MRTWPSNGHHDGQGETREQDLVQDREYWQETISEFLDMLGIGSRIAYEDAEGIEHHLHPVTISKLERLVKFLDSNPDHLGRFSFAHN